jgi:hypothetical protein
MWDQLPRSEQQRMIGELRNALHLVRDAGAVNTVHEPMTGTHSHAHHAYGSQGGDQNHEHEHEHGADGTPDANHDHGHTQASARGRHIRFQHGKVTVLNSAPRTPPPSPQQKARRDAAWDRLTRGVQDTRGQR